jgi:c-di-GMP-binding flagellar brake protein YcgR
MRALRTSNPVPSDAERTNERQRGRFRCGGLTATLDDVGAEVLDLSASGMRIRMPRALAVRVGEVARVTISSAAGSLPVRGRLVWATKRGLRRHEAGVMFVELDEKARAALVSIARYAAERETFARG